MCDCFHLAFPNWHAASSGTGPGRRLRAPEPGTEDDSTCDDPSEFTERPRPQGSSPVEEYPETEKYTDSDKECEAEHDPHRKTGSGKKSRKSGLGSMFEKRSTPKMSKLKEVHSPESGVIVKTAKDGCAEGLVYGGGGKEGIFIKEVVPESPASKSLKLKEGDQVLSATVYFDNVSYEDAIQILEHAQAYKVKLCLKRKPDIAETEPAIDSDVIPEEDVYAPEMRDQGKTKRRGDARISWPKFPSFGKGKKSRFTRSHSSSEADEQRKLELSPTTSDTESPIKSQDALKGKKKHKIKLSVMTKRGRVSSSEDTDAPTSAQMLSPEGLESPSREVYVTEDLKVGEASQEPSETRPAQHKVELISLDSTLKTEDLTVALAGQEGSSDLKSPDGKKKRSELKMKILGKDKAHKKAKSPKRLKTLGASIEQADQADTKTTTQMEMTLPKVELEISDAALIQKSPQKGEDKTKKGKDGKHKQETDATFKLPKVGFGDITSEEAIPKMNVNVGEPTVKIEQLTTEGTAAKDPYERLSKSDKLPKREDIEIPGMEDMSKKTKGKGIKEPKAVFTGHYEKMQADTVQMSIDVDSVKEAVSKLPGFKLPKIDTSGVPIPEEITVIDANAQRISVKTPTKIKHEEHSGKFDVTSSPDKFKTTFKLPTIAADLSSEELLMVTQADKDDYKRDKIIIPGKESAQEVTSLQTQEGGEAIESEYKSAATFKSKRAKIVMPSFGVGKPDIRIPDVGIYLPKQHSSEQKGGHIKGERTIFIQEEDEIPKTDTKYLIEGVVSDIKMPEIDGIEYIDGIDSVDGSPANGSIRRTGENLDGASPKVDYTFQDIGGEIYINDTNKDQIVEGAALKSPEREGKGIKFKLPSLGISRPKVKGPKIDLSLSKKDGDVTLLEAKAEAELPEIPEVELEKPELEIKAGRVEGELDGHGNKFKKPKFGIKIPKLKGPEFDSSKKEIEVKLPQYEVKHPEAPEIDVTLRAGDVSISGQKLEIDKPELEVKPLRIEGEFDGQGSKFKMPELGVKMPKMKRSEYDLSLSKKDVDITLPQVKADVKLPDVEYKEPGIKIEGPEISAGSIGTPHVSVEVSDMDKDVKFDGIDIKAPSVNVEGPSIDMRAEGKGSKFKMPHLGFSMPKVKGPQFSSSKKDIDVTLPEITVEAKGPKIDATLGKAEVLIPDVEVKKPELKIQPLQTDVELEAQGGKFQMPKFGITMPKLKGPEIHMGVSKKDGEVTLPEATIEGKTPKVDVSLGKVDVSLPEGKMEVKKPELEIEPLEGEVDIDGQKSNFKMPRLGMSMPKVKGPEFHFGLSRKDGDVTSPEAKVEVPECDIKGPSAQVEIKSPEIKIEAKGKDGSPSKFKMPTFKLPKFGVTSPNVSVDVPDMDKDVKISGADVDIPDKVHITAPSVDIEGPLIDVKTSGAEGDGKGGKFKMPNLSFSMPKMKGSKKDVDVKLPDVDLGKVDVTIPEAKIEVKEPEIEMQMQSEGKLDGQGEKFKMPKFGMSMPKVKGPEFHLGLSQKDVDVTLPEVKADVNLPDVELKKPSAEVEIKAPEIEVETKDAEASSKFKMPNLSFSMPKLKGPDIDMSLKKKDTGIKADIELPEAPKMEASLGKAEVEIPEAKIEVKKPEVVVKPLQTDIKIEGHKSKFQMPKFGVSMPKVKAPELDLSFSKKDVDVNLPDIKAKVELPEDPKIAVDMKTPKCEGEIDFSKKDFNVTQPEVKAEVNLPEVKSPEIETHLGSLKGSPSKFKLPTFKFPKFGVSTPNVSAEVPSVDKDIKIEGADMDISVPQTGVDVPGVKVEVNLPEVQVKKPSGDVVIEQPSIEVDGKLKKQRFSMPKFSFSKSSVKVPEVDASLPDVNVAIPEGKVDLKGDVDVKLPECEAEVEGSKFKMPKFGITMPNIKGPEIDLSLSKKDVDVTLPEVKGEVKLPEVELKEPSAKMEIKAPGIDVQTSGVEGSPSKMKMPTFKFPKFGVGSPKVSVEVPDVDKDIKIEGGTVDITAPSIDTGDLSVDMKVKGGEVEGSGSKFKMPKFGITMPNIKGPEIDLSLPKKDVDVTLPEAKAEVQLPDVNIKQPSATVEIKSPEIKTQTGSIEGSPSKFKLPSFTLPKFGVSSPKVSVEVPDVDKDVKIEGGTVDITAPSIDTEGLSMKAEGDVEVEGSGSKFKMPKFGISMPKVKGPEIDLSLPKKDVDVSLPETKLEITPPTVEVKQPEVEIKSPEIKVTTKDKEGSPSKFKMPTFKLPKFGVGMDKDVKIDGTDMNIPEEVLAVHIEAPSGDTKRPLIEIKTTGLKGPDVDVTLPEVKGEVKLPEVELKEPSAEVEVKAPEIKIVTKGKEGSPSKYKMPSFKLPKFGIGTPSATVEVPKKDVKIDGVDMKMPEEVLSVDIAAPSIDIKGPSADIKTTGIETEGKGGKFKLPSFGFSGPEVKLPDIDLSVSKKDVDVTLPEVKGEVKLPEVELKEPSAEVEVKAPEIKIATKGTEGSPSKYKMPTFKLPRFGIGMPSASVEVTKKDVKIDGADIKMPQEDLSVDIAAPSIDVKGPSVDIKTTGIEHEGKGSKFKLPSFGFSGPEVKLPDIDLSVSKKDVDVTLPEVKGEVKLPEVELKEPSAKMEIKAPGIDVQTSNVEGSPSKMKMPTFKLPKFGIDIPQVSMEVPDVDKDIRVDGADLKLPEAKVEVKLPAVEIKEPSISVPQEPTIEGDAKMKKSWTLPKFSFSKTSVKSPEAEVNLEIPKVDVSLPEVKADVQLPDVEPSGISVEGTPAADIDVKIKKPRFSLPKFSFSKQTSKESNVDVSLPEVDVSLPKGSVEVKQPEVEVKGPEFDVELEGQESKFKMPKFGISLPTVKGPEIDLSLPKKDIDVTLPEAKAEVQLPDVKIKQPSATVDIKAPGIDVQTSDVDGSPSKMKMPSFKLPKFGVGTPKVSVEVPDVDKDIKIEGGTVDITAPSIDTGDLSVDMKVKGGEVEGPGSKFKMPKFGISLPKVKGPEIDVSLPKKDVDVTLPEAEVQLPDVELKQPSAAVEIKAPGIDVQTSGVEGSPSKMKMPTFKFPKFGVGSPKVSVEVPDVEKDIKIEGGTVDITAPSIDTEGLSVDMKVKGGEVEASGSKFKMPKFGISLPKVKGPEIDLSLPKTDVDVTLPEAKAEVQLPDVEIKPPSATVEIKGPEIEGNIEGSPSKLKMPSFTLPKFGVGSPKVSVEVPDVDKDIKIEGGTVDITAPSIDAGDLSVDMKVKGGEVEGSKFKMPKFGISLPKVKGPEIDVSLSKGDVDIAQPEVKAEVELPGVEVKTPESAISAPDAPTVDVETKSKRANWSFPKFSFSRSGGKTPDVDVNLETPKVDVTTPEIKAEVTAPSLAISTDDSPVTELDASLKKSKFSLPKFSFAKSSSKESEITAEPPRVDISLPEGEVIVKQPEIKMKAPELEVEHDGQGSKFKLPNFGIALPKVKGSEDDSNQGKEVASITLPEVKAEVKLPEVEVKESAASETEIKTKDIGGSPLKFKMPTMKMPKFGAAADVTVEAPGSEKTAETEVKLKEDITLNIKGPSVDIKMDTEAKTDSEKPKTETDTAGLGSPSKFKLPLFKMPVLGFSRSETSPADAESKEGMTVEVKAESKSPKAESKSPKAAFTSFGEILKNIDVEFDVPKTPDHLESPKEVTETEEKKKETNQESTKSPERTGWFKFPKFGLSSPSSPAKSPEKVEKSLVDEEISPTCSIQSSDAFADISSAMTSEHVGVSLSSPTKVMVKYSDPSHDSELGEMHSNVITSTTRTEIISVEPNLPEKITILSSGLSSSSEDTLRLNSGKIHVITSNIQATPESQQAKIMTAVQIRSVEGLPQESSSTASWTVGDSQGGKRSVFERRVVRETSSERSESKETIVITKQITRVVNSSEPISGETASSIQRLKDSVHSEKMRFFDGADE